ncbi:MAG: tetratricopeptide repeat protein [Meiothermus sp.]|uniref:tetratricopeptide repeat protein n=1 Tax=Meiothermus sp. TaxID=1955249 RepID=UPI0025F64A78|nr:tetratricopeptide repeat protein [Meiothermus sp.]MCS7069273.1 tetratricopeptide repeat protein [Meiothermus sp.]
MVLKRAGLALALWGEPGIGKSHTARELLQETPCRSVSLHATVLLPDLARALSRPARLPMWAQTLLERMQRGEHVESGKAASALSAVLAASAPVILHLEDLHEAGPERLEFVEKLAGMASHTKGTALLVTSRVRPPEPFTAFRMEPLDAESIRRLLEAEAGATLPPEALGWIHTQAAGNPLFTLEFFRHLARRGFLWNDGRQWRWRAPAGSDVPHSVEALIERLIQEATARPELKDALEARAILPSEVSDALWVEVAGLSHEALSRAVLEFQRRGLLRGEQFAHPLFRELSLSLVSPARRGELARRALEALRERNPQEAATLVGEAGLDGVAALELLHQAVRSARLAGNEVQAARWLAQAVEYAEGEAQGKMALEAAQVLQHYDLSQAARLFKLALATPAAGVETVRAYAHLLARQGRIPDVKALWAELPARLREGIEAPVLAITTYHVGGNNSEALEVWEAHPQLHAHPSPELLRAVAASALAMGRMEQAQTLAAQGLTIPNPALRCEFLSIQALIYYHQGQYNLAEATLAEALVILTRLNAPRLRATALVNRAAFLRMLGRYREMNRCLEEALQIRREAGDVKGYAFALAALAELLIEQGHYERAEEALSEAITALEPYGPDRFLANAHSMASLLYRSQGTPIAKLLALKHADQALAYARQIGSPRVVREILFDASLAATAAGFAERGLELAAEAQKLGETAGDSPHDNFRTLWARGMALEARGDPAALETLRRAVELARPLDVAIDEHKLGLELDRLTGNVESARHRLAWFEERGLMNGVNLARRYFPQLAEAPPANPESAGPKRLEVLGSMCFAGEPLRGRKRQELLALLLETRLAGRVEVGKLELLDHLYPGEDEGKAASSLKELIHSVRVSLGALVVATTASGYALGAAVSSDLEEFLRTGEARLWRGVYLGGLASLHETVRESVYLGLRTRAQALLEADPKEAARLGRILLEADPYDLEALRLTLGALRRSGNHKSLGRLYEEARGWMLEVGETLPEHWQGFLTL